MKSAPSAERRMHTARRSSGLGPCNANDYDVSDASKIKSTNFEVVAKEEGKLYRKASISEVLSLIKQLANQYL